MGLKSSDYVYALTIKLEKNKMIHKPIYIITGGPGFGKTQLIEDLHHTGYLCSGEYAREIIDNQLIRNGELLPWKNTKLFQAEVLKKRIKFFESVPDGCIAFADRGIPDQLAFAEYKGFSNPEILVEMANKYRYAPTVFIAPPWPEIFENDQIRIETFEEAVKIDLAVRKSYTELKYQLIDLPLVSVKERKQFILQTVLKI